MSFLSNHRLGSAIKIVLKVIRITVGVLLVLIGLIGGLIPIFQGWIFGLAGLALLSVDVRFVRRWYRLAKRRVYQLRKRKSGSRGPQT
ncbi:MAG: hypothetical protein ABIH23_00025 [bacterium]